MCCVYVLASRCSWKARELEIPTSNFHWKAADVGADVETLTLKEQIFKK